MTDPTVELIVELVVGPGGTARCLYAEEVDLAGLGEARVPRASHVEPDEAGAWWADLSPRGRAKAGAVPQAKWGVGGGGRLARPPPVVPPDSQRRTP